MKKELTVITLILLSTTIVLADYSIDISGLKSDDYVLGEEIVFRVVLLDGDDFVNRVVEVEAMDALAKKVVSKSILSNQDSTIKIGSDYPSGLWSIKASVDELSVDRSFTIDENLDVEFVLDGDELIIKNLGNVRYTKTIEITIGDAKNSYAQNIGIGEEKVLQLISAEGNYDIVVTDGTNTVRKDNVYIAGGTTGNVIGAVDKELVGYTGFAGAADPTQEEGQFVSLSKLPLALTFVAAVLILGGLVFAANKMKKK